MKNGTAVVASDGKCGAKAKSTGRPCRRAAGHGTDHLGEGRCLFHGGASLVKHGRYSTITREPIRKLIEAYEADPDPLNLEPELALLRALVVDYINRNELASDGEKPLSEEVVDTLRRLAGELLRGVARIERNRAMNAISQAELYRFLKEVERVIRNNVTDEKVLERIGAGISQILVRPNEL